ncbi:hypothetical protein [Mesobacillus harenae]|nr:hypothetical protein [Mesobacillus harenae]
MLADNSRLFVFSRTTIQSDTSTFNGENDMMIDENKRVGVK